jgi:hypothetical protein
MLEPDDTHPPRHSWLSTWRDGVRRFTAPPASSEDELSLKPSAMRGTEALYGYVVALELIVVAIVNLTVTHGKGAPKNPQTALSLVGLAASIALVLIVRTGNRMIVSLSAIGAAFFVTLPAVPNSVRAIHILALIIPVIYAFILTQRQRRATTALAKAGRAGRSSPARGATKAAPGERAAEDRNRRRAKKKGAATGPVASRRYTPPKPKRPRPQPAPEPASPRRKWWGRPDEN